MTEPIVARFMRVADAAPDRIAVDDGTRRVTYADLKRSVRQLANVIAVQTKPDDLVCILLPSSVDYPVAMLACLAAGRIFVPLDLRYPQKWILDVADQSGMTAIICDLESSEEIAQIFQNVRKIDVASRASHDEVMQPANVDAPAFVLFTSGSTGQPRGIVNSQRNLLRRVAQYVNAAHINESDRFLPLSSECTIAGLRERLTALLTGATLHLADVQRLSARALLNRLGSSEISIIYAVPALLRTLMQLGVEKAPSSLRIVRVGGEAVLWSDVEKLRQWLPHDCLILLGYSSTEAPIMQWFVPKNFVQNGNHVPLGYPLAGNLLAVADEEGNGVVPGDVGELVVGSPYVALGRWIDGHCASDNFPSDPRDPSCRVLRTGDLVRQRHDGLIDLVGRQDRQIKIHGQRVEPGELEAVLRRHPGVRDAAVFPRQVGKSWRLVAYVVPEADATDLAPRLKTDLRSMLPTSLMPQQVHLIDAVPRLASAKLDMQALKNVDEKFQREELLNAGKCSGGAPRGETELIVAQVWQTVLGLEFVDRDKDFFDLGGDSLTALNLIFGIEEAFGVELPVTTIYRTPTIATLSAALDARIVTEFSPLVLVNKGESGVPLFVVHGIGGNVMELMATLRQVISDGPVYAIQAKGLDGRDGPNRTVADMADYYIATITELYPDSACHLAGYSAGGLVAIEMARRLAEQNLAPASLTLIDTQTNARQWPLSLWLGLLLRRVRHHFRAAIHLSTRQRVQLAIRVTHMLFDRIRWRFGRPVPSFETQGIRIPQALIEVYQATLEAVANYRAARYDGPVTLIVPTTKDALMASAERIWRSNVASLTVQTVEGDHHSMIQAGGGQHVARVLSSLIANARRSHSAPQPH